MSLVVWVRIVGVHELDGVEDAEWVQCVIVLVDVVLHHDVEEVPAHRVVRSYTLVGIYSRTLSGLHIQSISSRILTQKVAGIVPGHSSEILELGMILLVLIQHTD